MKKIFDKTLREAALLDLCEDVIKNGIYKDHWESLSKYPVPKWYSDAKFGIFIHWGVYSVPAFNSEWYPRFMYEKGNDVYNHHIETYGEHKNFGYHDFIPMFKAEKFNAKKWAELFRASGAKYIMPVAEHHDGFTMYDTDLSKWKATTMGPCKDIIGELKTETENLGMKFCVSSHRAEHVFFKDNGLDFDSGVQNPDLADFYFPLVKKADEHEDLYDGVAPKEHLDNWLARCVELVDKYKPSIVWFDWWIQHIEFKPYLKKFMAYYYNRATEWGIEVAINYKYDACAYGTAVYDIERGQLAGISPRLWQNDTAIAKNSWGYTENNSFKTTRDIICDLVDIVSKNGCLLLNIGPKSDGTITDEETAVLLSIGTWLKANGEGIYGTTFWRTYGEGPTEIPEGAFTDVGRGDFTKEDIRFTYKEGCIYAFCLNYPANNEILIKSLKDNKLLFHAAIKNVSVLGYSSSADYSVDENGLNIKTIDINTDLPVCFKIELV